MGQLLPFASSHRTPGLTETLDWPCVNTLFPHSLAAVWSTEPDAPRAAWPVRHTGRTPTLAPQPRHHGKV